MTHCHPRRATHHVRNRPKQTYEHRARGPFLIQTRRRRSVHLGTGELDNLGPLLGFLDDELAELGR
jgi:hypothetical protein